jgi:hypothetical protein
MFERVITQTIQTISQQVLRERSQIALSEILEDDRIPYRFKPFFETEVYWWLHNEMLARSANKRFDYENPELASLLSYLEQVQFRHSRFERDEFMSVLDSAVKLSYNYLCRPQITLKWYLFRGQPVKPLREVMLRFGAFVDYSYFFHVFSEWVERKIRERPTFDAISATEFERIIRRVDDQILLSCTVEDLLSMMDPLFEFIGEGEDLIIPIDALIIFFDDKNINKLVEHLERIRERGMTTVGKEEFVGLLDELLTSADENPEADFSNVYQNDELDDVVRMHLQSGVGRVGGAEDGGADIVAAEAPVATPPTAAAATAVPATTATHMRAPRQPVDPALLDALDADEPSPGAAERSPEAEPAAPIEVNQSIPQSPAVDEERVAEERVAEERVAEEGAAPEQIDVDDESHSVEPGPEPFEPVADRQTIDDDLPVDDEPEVEVESSLDHEQQDSNLRWTVPDESANAEIEEWVDGLAEALEELEAEPSAGSPALNGNGLAHATSSLPTDEIAVEPAGAEIPPVDEIDRSVDMHSDESEETPGETDVSPPVIDDTVVDDRGSSDVAPDDVFETIPEPADEPAIFEIVDLEDEFEDDIPDDIDEGDAAADDNLSVFPENPIAGRLSALESQSGFADNPVEEQSRPVDQVHNGAVYPPFEPTGLPEKTTPGMSDVRRHIDGMLERKLVKKIFMRDRAAYDAALDQINAAGTWRAASQILDEIFIRYEIDPYSRTALRFTDSVYARYLPGKQ